MATNETTNYREKIPDPHQIIFRTIHSRMTQDRFDKRESPYIVGINGVDTSGKTQFSYLFSKYLNEIAIPTQIVHIDDFSNDHDLRHKSGDDVKDYYENCFDVNLLVNEILRPASEKMTLDRKIMLIDLMTNERSVEKYFFAEKGYVIILEGVFIFRPEIIDYLDFKIYIDIPIEEVMSRATIRDVPLFGNQVLNKYVSKYIPAQIIYMNVVKPKDIADLVVNNMNPNYPIIN